MKNKTWKLLVFILLPIVAWIIYSFYLSEALKEAYTGNPDEFIETIITNYYPRFFVEKNRFDLTFFQAKVQQVMIRFTLVYFIIGISYYFYQNSIRIKNRISAFTYTETTKKNIAILRILTSIYLCYLALELGHDLVLLQPMLFFYKPVFWLKILNIPFPSPTIAIACSSLLIFSAIMMLLNFKKIIFASASLVIFFFLQCWVFSFEKFDHGFVTITYALILLPFLFEESETQNESFNSWALQLIRISICLVYLLSGLEKLFIAQTNWFNPENFKGYMGLHETYLSDLIVQSDFLCLGLSILTLIIQVGFISILIFPSSKKWFLLGGFLFHTGTYLIMNIGTPFNPWIVVYAFFIDWEFIYDKIPSALKKGVFLSK